MAEETWINGPSTKISTLKLRNCGDDWADNGGDPGVVIQAVNVNGHTVQREQLLTGERLAWVVQEFCKRYGPEELLKWLPK